MATAPKIEPAKAPGKQKTPSQAASGAPDDPSAKASTPSLLFEGPTPLWDTLLVAQKLLMGYSDGDLVDIGELEREARECERSTRETILKSQPTKKISAFHSGFNKWQEKLCASATNYTKHCFSLFLDNRVELDVNLSWIAAKTGSTAKIESPAEFARDFIAGDLSAFLRVTALEGKKKAREIGSDGRVREFIRYVCGDFSGRHTELNTNFRLPQWFSHEWTVNASMAKLRWWPPGSPSHAPTIDESITLSTEETDSFILGWEEILITKVSGAIYHAHLKAILETTNGIPSSKSESQGERMPAQERRSTRISDSKSYKRSDKMCIRLGIIFRAIDSGKTGLDYCKFLDANGLTTPDFWRGDGCPESHSLAYQKPFRLGRKLQKLIRSEKSRDDRLYSKLRQEDPAELRRILDISGRPKP
ncbi:MAG: hypothetical protein ACRD20_00715 [Terriglobales bacterium]